MSHVDNVILSFSILEDSIEPDEVQVMIKRQHEDLFEIVTL